MKKIFLLCMSLLCSCTMYAQKSYSIHDLKKILKEIISQSYDAKIYPWEYSSFKDIYIRNIAIYKNPSYITSKEIFIPLFESINKRLLSVKKEENSNIAGKKNQKFIIMGSLYGGAQCLLDYIDQWRRDDIITEELLLPKNYMLIFLGNAIGKSPYSLETLAIIGLLIQKNPNNVIYIQGEQEYQEQWLDHSLEDQIATVQNFSTISAYQQCIETFFANCPRAVTINFDSHDKMSILCTSSGKNALKYITTPIDAIFSGIDDFIVHENNMGLFLMLPVRGATNWKVFSACTPFMKEYYNFSTHSYIILDSDSNTVTHVYRREKDTEYQHDVYNVHTGLLNALKKTTELAIGSSMDLSGQLGAVGRSIGESIFESLLEYNNQDFSKKIIRAHVLDDRYIPYKTYMNIQALKKQGITTILLPLGTANVDSFLDDIRKSELLVLFPLMDGRYPEIKNLIHYRASYAQEAEALIKNLLSKSYVKNIVIFYQDDAFGIGPRDVVHTLLKEKNVNWVDVPYSRTDIMFTSAAEKIKQSNADAIAFFAIPDAANALIKELKTYTLANKKLIGLSILFLNGFDKPMYKLGLDFTFASVVPNPLTSDLQIAREYRTMLSKYSYNPDIASFEGYIGMQLFLDAFKAVGYTLDPTKLVHHFENMKKITFKGLPLNFDSSRSLSNTVWIVEGPDKEWIPYTLS